MITYHSRSSQKRIYVIVFLVLSCFDFTNENVSINQFILSFYFPWLDIGLGHSVVRLAHPV